VVARLLGAHDKRYGMRQFRAGKIPHPEATLKEPTTLDLTGCRADVNVSGNLQG